MDHQVVTESDPTSEVEASWALAELAGAALGDARRTTRLVQLVTTLAQRSASSLPEACRSPAELKAAYRFFSNAQVTPEALLRSHVQATRERLQGEPVVLAVQDTTVLDFSHHPATQGLGPLNDLQHHGLLAHTTLALTPQRVPLGLVAQEVLVRDPADFGKRQTRKQRAIEQKESHKWLRSLEAVNALAPQCPGTHLVSVGDRESDVYELLAARRQANVDVLVRASWDRALVAQPGTPAEQRRLWTAVTQLPVAGTLEVAVPAQPGQPGSGRTAQLVVRWGAVTLRPPRRSRPPDLTAERPPPLQPVKVWAVWAYEPPPPGGKPLEWLLLTTETLSSPEQGLERVAWYACRWGIEVFHKVLKSGCRIEARQLATAAALQRALTLYSIIAWRILWATLVVRAAPDLPASVLLDRDEWEALYCTTYRTAQPPATPPTLRDVVAWLARLGGFGGRRGDGAPGVTVLWRGFSHLVDLTTMYRIIRPPPARDVGKD